MDLYESIKELCEQKGMTIVGLERELGFGRGSLGKLQKGQSIRSDRLHQIEEYFGVKIGEDGYYYNDDIAKLAKEMFNDPDMRTLYDLKEKMGEKRFRAHIEFMRKMYEEDNHA